MFSGDPAVEYIIFKPDHWPLIIHGASPTAAGVMSAADKAKLDGIPAGGASLQSAYDNGNVIVIADATGSVTIKDGVVPATVELFKVVDNAETRDLFFVQGDGAFQSFGASGDFNFQTGVNRYCFLSNATLATAGVPVQYSPFFQTDGHAWATGVGADRRVRFFWGTQPVSGATVSGNLVWYSKIAAGADVQVLALTSVGQLRGVDGGASTPTYSFSSDPTSGMSLAFANILAFYTNSTQRVTIDTANFATTLPIYSAASGAANTITVGDGNDGGFAVAMVSDAAAGGAGSLQFFPASTFAVPGDVRFLRTGASALLLDNGAANPVDFTIATRILFGPTGIFKNLNAGNESGGANAGGSLLPATPQGFLSFVDSGNVTRKIPYYLV